MTIDEVLRTDDWAEVESVLVGHLAGLHRQGFVTLEPPEPPPGPPPQDPPSRGVLGRLRRQRITVRDRPLVQLARENEYLDAECSGPVGDPGVDGGYPWDEEQQRRLLALGWQPPEELDDWHMYRWYGPAPDGLPDRLRQRVDDAAPVPPATAADAARLVVATLRDVYGMRSPAGLHLVVDRLPG
ncbi:TY-Chap domain-containing protein [Cellulomonas aerilata]|uniref:TY-Chap N-terminal domain-containing protein n=1 Tax=Cellulomonas aerilata TaxID=515326 RepID=A0A512DFJ6_9CELL|nr:hypothetical protein [Cellulomonas aerilata]GEO35231.1 hypothetical protein CAE01nite_29560 [Cellulomonas aerilata]